MVHGGSATAVVEVEVETRPLRPGHLPVLHGNSQLQLLLQTILPHHRRLRVLQPILRLPRPRVPQFLLPLPRPLRRQPLLPLLPHPQSTLVLAWPAGW